MVEFASQTMKDLKGYLPEEKVNLLLEATTNLRDRLILQIMYRCGRRVSEVLALTVDDIIWEENKIIFTILKRKKPIKELKPVDSGTMRLLRAYVDGEVTLKGVRKGIKEGKLFPVTRQYVFKLIRKLGKQVGIERVGLKKLHPHHLRHSFAVHQVRTNVKTAEDLRKLQMYMSHANIATTSHYLQFSPDELRELVSTWDKKEKLKGKGHER
ncbi:MAG: tyrosine-type recombinase/integrase [Candidatus Aenigmarchaeota archaeon]|nr:tyrosine-type recombinase/integrase [Candidatus Aenigmarchaeota archaeon]NIP40633.1 tyrosine-type recombinase/integrase [Candidatus Aenigmarchaeota archaeon]NIQ17584.1 tyrosine-type recombinase/integrase [Candidatus Aenigmarchaeota archaeon]NIS73344.1 tyrosine-type recombinase/integrase [Candidatus Aenigmarchaeota archaeon]